MEFVYGTGLDIDGFGHTIDAVLRVLNPLKAEKLAFVAFPRVRPFNRIQEAPPIAGKTLLRLIRNAGCDSSGYEGFFP